MAELYDWTDPLVYSGCKEANRSQQIDDFIMKMCYK